MDFYLVIKKIRSHYVCHFGTTHLFLADYTFIIHTNKITLHIQITNININAATLYSAEVHQCTI